MTITNTILRNDYVANGSSTVFSFTFIVLSETAGYTIQVITTDLIGIETLKTQGVDYTVQLNDNGLGTITFTTAPLLNHKITLLSNVPNTQETDYIKAGTDKFPAESHEKALDKLTLIAKQFLEKFNRIVSLPKSSTLSNIEFPINASNANQILAINNDGTNLTTKNLADVGIAPVSAYAKTLLDDVNSSEARATLDTQQLNANLTALAGLTGASNKIPMFSGAGAMVLTDKIIPATTAIQGISYINNRVSLVNEGTSITDTIGFNAGTFITLTGQQIYLPLIRKKIQSSGVWTAGDTNNGLDTGARVANTFYRTYVIQNNSTSVYDILFSTSYLSPTIPSGYTNLGLMDYAFIRTNSSNVIAISKWDVNNKRLVLGAGESIEVFNSGAGSGNVIILNTTEPLEFIVRTYLQTISSGNSDLAVYGSEHSSSDPNDTILITTNNGFLTAGGGSVYTSDGKIYWKNFAVSAGVTNQTCKIKSIKIRS